MHGRRCRVVARARTMNSALVEFDCGWRVVTSRNYLRRAAGCAPVVLEHAAAVAQPRHRHEHVESGTAGSGTPGREPPDPHAMRKHPLSTC